MPRALTDRQRSVLQMIARSIQKTGRPPTLREIGTHLNISSTNGVRDHLQALVDKGYIERDERSARGIRLVDRAGVATKPVFGGSQGQRAGRRVVRVPVLGRVAAGQPLLAEEAIEDHLLIDQRIVRDGEVFALRVQGQSMIDAGIEDGDYVFVRQAPTVEPGDIVVALVGEEATVKRWYQDGDRIRLQPENPAMAPLYVREEDGDFRILGKVAAVLKLVY